MKRIKDLNKFTDTVFMDCKTQYNKDVNFPPK